MLPPHQKLSFSSPRELASPQPPVRLLVAAAAILGALAALLGAAVVQHAAPWVFTGSIPATVVAPEGPNCDVSGKSSLTFAASRAEAVLGELSVKEVRAVAAWFSTEFGAAGKRNSSSDCLWMAGPSAVELLRPPKAATVAYLEGHGPPPVRFARVTAVGPRGVEEYKVGPIEGGALPRASAELLTSVGDVPFVKRPTEANGDNRIAQPLVTRALRVIGTLLVEAFGPTFAELEGFDSRQGKVGWMLRNDALSTAGQRSDMLIFQWYPPAPARKEASWLHPLPLEMKLNTTDRDSNSWHLLEIYFCGQGPFRSAEDLKEAHLHGRIRICPFQRTTGTWNVPQHTTPRSPGGLHPKEAHSGVTWGPWSFTVTQRPSTGPALLDVRFRGERVLYELALQDAQAAYSGSERTQFFYADASWSLSMLSASLEPGVDCPTGAHFLPVVNWIHIMDGGVGESDPTKPRTFYPICVFEWTEDHTIWRHMQNSDPPDVRGLLRKTVVVRSIATIGNYDYITDIKLREDGEIEVKTRFAGFIESRYYNVSSNPEEANFSTLVRPDLAGPVHSHLVNWKADIDVAGVKANALRITKVKAGPLQGQHVAGSHNPLVSKYLENSYVEKEGQGVSTFVAHPEHPTIWAIVDRKATSPAGNPRGYAITLASWATTQVLPDSHPFVRALPLTKYHLAVTRYHDEEYRASSPYVQYDGQETTRNAQDVDRFLTDAESLVDEDLVAWIGVGREHIVRQEDLPLVSNFGAGFSLQPWNFFTQNVVASPPWAI